MAGPKHASGYAADRVPVEQRTRLHEVADELLNIYETLVAMRYIDPEALVRGPHELNDDLLASYAEFELDPAIFYLYSIMPYIDSAETDARDFFQGGALFNQLSIEDVKTGRDPHFLSPEGGFDDECGQYMYPWYTPLSSFGNRSPIIIYDAKLHRIWITEQGGSSTDPVFCKGWYGESESTKDQASNWGDSSSSNWDSELDGEEDMDFSDDDSNGSSEFWDDEDEISDTREIDELVGDQTEEIDYDEGFEQIEELSNAEREEATGIKNKNSLELARSRSAGDVLRDIHRFYNTLKELPGQGEYSRWMEPAILKPVYLKNGWPHQFDAEKFEVDVARAYATKRARYFAEEPLRQLKCYVGWAEYSRRDIEQYRREIAEAGTPDGEWTARFKLWKAQDRSERNAKDLAEAKKNAEKLCPNGICQKEEDLPLWEMEQLRKETQGKRTLARRNDHVSSGERLPEDPEQLRHLESRHRRAQKQLAGYEKALEQSAADAERLRPGVTFEEATGIPSRDGQNTLSWLASQKEAVEDRERDIQNLLDFEMTVPADAPKATRALDEEKEDLQRALVRARQDVENTERWLAEHENTH